MSTEKLTEFSSRLKEAREQKKLSKAETARLVGVSAAYIGQLESMTELYKKTPSVLLIEKLSNVLEINSVWLSSGEGEIRPPPSVAETKSGYGNQPLTAAERYLIKTYRKLNQAEKDKVIEIAELYCGAKESWKDVGGGSVSKESNSK